MWTTYIVSKLIIFSTKNCEKKLENRFASLFHTHLTSISRQNIYYFHLAFNDSFLSAELLFSLRYVCGRMVSASTSESVVHRFEYRRRHLADVP